MKIYENEITADEGMILTNGECYSTYVVLGIFDSFSNWHESPLEEAEENG